MDEIHTLLGTGGSGSSDAANILKPALARGEVRLIGATTPKEYAGSIERDAALARRFEAVRIEEPSSEETLQIIRGARTRLEEHHALKVSDDAIQAAVELSGRYLPDLRWPDKALDLLDQACAGARFQSLTYSPERDVAIEIGRDEVASVIAKRARVPVERLTSNEASRLLAMEETLARRVIGQDEAIGAVAEAIRAARAGLKEARRPIGVFLFAGPTGTGKTELAKALAEFLFDDEAHLIRIDMSEYMEKHALSRLIGAPPGYIGHEEEGQLTSAVRQQPYSVVLFDEIEKAHPDIWNLWLQIFDDGRLTDAHGRHISFAETLVILTTNLGSTLPDATPRIGLRASPENHKQVSRESYRADVISAVRSTLKPELINRIGRVVVFNPLYEEAVRRIIDKIIARLQERLSKRGVTLELSGSAYEILLREGYDLRYGAREMERVVQRRIAMPLAQMILAGAVAEGVTVRATGEQDEIALTILNMRE